MTADETLAVQIPPQPIDAEPPLREKEIRSALGFKTFYCAPTTLKGAELIQRSRQGQMPPLH